MPEDFLKVKEQLDELHRIQEREIKKMEPKTVNSDISNPLVLKNSKFKALDTAYKTLIQVLKEYYQESDLSPEDIAKIKEILSITYREKRMKYFVECKIHKFENYLSFMTEVAFENIHEPVKNKEFGNVPNNVYLVVVPKL
jgi:hypothetical protein